MLHVLMTIGLSSIKDKVLHQQNADSIVTHIIRLLRGNSDMHSSPSTLSIDGQNESEFQELCWCGPALMCRAIFMCCFSVLGKWNLTLSPTYLAQCSENLFVSYYAAMGMQ